MSEKEKSKGAQIGEAIQRVREFGEKKDLPEETIKDFIKSDIEEIREDDEKDSTEDWLESQVAGNGDATSLSQTLSQEGFLDSAGDVVRNLIRGKKPDMGNLYQKDTRDTIARTYGNPSWVNSRRVVTGNFMVQGGSCLQGNYEQAIRQHIQAAKALWASNKPVMAQLVKNLKPYTDLLTTDAWKNPANVDKVDALPALPQGATFKELKENNFEAKDVKLPALTAEGVVTAANLVLLLRDAADGVGDPFKESGWNDIFHTTSGRNSVRAFTDNDPRWAQYEKHYADDSDTLQKLGAICENVATYGYGVEYDWSANAANGYYEIYSYMRALVKYIDASVR